MENEERPADTGQQGQGGGQQPRPVNAKMIAIVAIVAAVLVAAIWYGQTTANGVAPSASAPAPATPAPTPAITAITSTAQPVQTPGAKINLFGADFVAPGTEIPALTGAESANANLLKREAGNRVAQLQEFANRFNAVTRMNGVELTEGDAEEFARALHDVAQNLAGGVAATHRGDTASKIATLYGIHDQESQSAFKLIVRQRPTGKYDYFTVDGEGKETAFNNAIGSHVQFYRSHELTWRVIALRAVNYNHNSVALPGVYAADLNTARPIDSSTCEVTMKLLPTHDLSRREIVREASRLLGRKLTQPEVDRLMGE